MNNIEKFDTAVDIGTAVPPSVALVNSAAVVESVNGTIVTLGSANNNINPNTGEVTTFTTFDLFQEVSYKPITQIITAQGTTVIDALNGNSVVLNQSANITTLTLTPRNTTDVTILDITRVPTGSFSITWGADCYFEGGVKPTLSSSAEDIIEAMFIPNLGGVGVNGWLMFASTGYTISTFYAQQAEQPPAPLMENVGRTKAPESETLRYVGGRNQPSNYSMSTVKNVESRDYIDSYVVLPGQELTTNSAKELIASDIVYDKTRHAYPEVLEFDGWGTTMVNQIQSVTAVAATSINLNNGSIVFLNQAVNITSLAFTNLASGTNEHVVVLIRKKDNTATARTITFDSSVYWGESSDAPTFTQTANAIDVIYLVTADNGANWSVTIKNNFRV